MRPFAPRSFHEQHVQVALPASQRAAIVRDQVGLSKREHAVRRDPVLTAPPRWVAALVDECPAEFSLISAQIADAAGMPSGAFTDAVTEQYRRIVASLHGQSLHAV